MLNPYFPHLSQEMSDFRNVLKADSRKKIKFFDQSFSENHVLNRNIIRIIFNLPNSKSLVELMKLIISRTGLLFCQIFSKKARSSRKL